MCPKIFGILEVGLADGQIFNFICFNRTFWYWVKLGQRTRIWHSFFSMGSPKCHKKKYFHRKLFCSIPTNWDVLLEMLLKTKERLFFVSRVLLVMAPSLVKALRTFLAAVFGNDEIWVHEMVQFLPIRLWRPHGKKQMPDSFFLDLLSLIRKVSVKNNILTARYGRVCNFTHIGAWRGCDHRRMRVNWYLSNYTS